MVVKRRRWVSVEEDARTIDILVTVCTSRIYVNSVWGYLRC